MLNVSHRFSFFLCSFFLVITSFSVVTPSPTYYSVSSDTYLLPLYVPHLQVSSPFSSPISYNLFFIFQGVWSTCPSNLILCYWFSFFILTSQPDVSHSPYLEIFLFARFASFQYIWPSLFSYTFSFPIQILPSSSAMVLVFGSFLWWNLLAYIFYMYLFWSVLTKV